MNIFKQFYRSLFSPKDIALFRFQGIGKTILYIFVLMAIVSIPAGVSLALSLSNGVQQFHQAIESDIPDFEFTNGVLTSEIDEPFIEELDGVIFVLDPTDTVSSDELLAYNNGLALTSRDAYLITDGIIEQIRYRDFGNINMTKTEIEALIAGLSSMMPVIITLLLLVLYIFTTGMKFIGVTVLGVIGLIIRSKLGVKLTYKQLWVLSAYAVTLPTTIFALLDLLYLNIPFSFTIYWVLAIVMLYMAAQRVPKPRPKVEVPEE
ncbi:DUF1189 domain-containing protein [Bacillus sp. FJAT-45350]|uniref:DUF1189 domain-containing protein n=1 Tax=Bacillus sp. FJAT-45350 TaxID=2011014 RepID=UPI000BB76870|nr:DUF1189 domain-containing protein [Bacillus sp. FJAT-45350]